MLKSVEGRRFGSSEGRARADPQALALTLGTAPSLTTDLGAMVLQGADMLVTSQPQTFTNRRPGSLAPQATPASAAVNVSGSMEPPSLRATEPPSHPPRTRGPTLTVTLWPPPHPPKSSTQGHFVEEWENFAPVGNLSLRYSQVIIYCSSSSLHVNRVALKRPLFKRKGSGG